MANFDSLVAAFEICCSKNWYCNFSPFLIKGCVGQKLLMDWIITNEDSLKPHPIFKKFQEGPEYSPQGMTTNDLLNDTSTT